MSDVQRPVPPADGGAPIAAILTAAASASSAYSAATARGAATALVHVLAEQGVFGASPAGGGPPAASKAGGGPYAAAERAAPAGPEPGPPPGAPPGGPAGRGAVRPVADHAGARWAGAGQTCPDVTCARLVDEIIRRALRGSAAAAAGDGTAAGGTVVNAVGEAAR